MMLPQKGTRGVILADRYRLLRAAEPGPSMEPAAPAAEPDPTY